MKPIVSINYLRDILGFEYTFLQEVSKKAGRYYSPFDTRKSPGLGEWRHIDNPVGPLKPIQQRINKKILSLLNFPETMFGGIAKRSIFQNAKLHLKKPLIVTLDLRKCFMMVGHKAVHKVFRDIYNCSPEIALLFRKLTTFQNRLPQGAPTSPLLANAALLPMYYEIRKYCSDRELLFSIFVDDIVISGELATQVIDPIIKIIMKHDHAIKRPKIKIMHADKLQIVNGLVVNQKLSISKVKKDKFKDLILELSLKESIFEHEQKRVRGILNHFKQINTVQARVLELLSLEYLPKNVVSDDSSVKKIKPETRKCSDASRHTYLGNYRQRSQKLVSVSLN